MSIFYYGINDLDQSGNLLFLVNTETKCVQLWASLCSWKQPQLKDNPLLRVSLSLSSYIYYIQQTSLTEHLRFGCADVTPNKHSCIASFQRPYFPSAPIQNILKSTYMLNEQICLFIIQAMVCFRHLKLYQWLVNKCEKNLSTVVVYQSCCVCVCVFAVDCVICQEIWSSSGFWFSDFFEYFFF